MAEAAASYKKALPPHTRGADALSKRFWGQWIALAPLFLTACFTGHVEILRLFLVCLVSAVAFEFLAVKLFRKKEKLRSGETVPIPINRSEAEIGAVSAAINQNKIKAETVFVAALFALLMPSKCPSEIVILGVFFAVVAGKELFGGTGAYPLHPLLLARAFLQISFPKVMAEPMLLAGDGNLWTLVALGLGGILLLSQRQGYWETPVLFTAVCFIRGALLGGRGMPPAFFSGVLLTALFLLADSVTLPLTRKGRRLFVLGAALLSSSLGGEGFSIGTAVYAILLMDLVTPWLDVWLKPAPYKTKRLIKATYPV